MLLALSLLALATGPLLFKLARHSRGTASALDGFVRVSVVGLVLGGFLPQAWETGGWLALCLFLGGMFLPQLLHAASHRSSRRGSALEISVASLAFVIHAWLDGSALVEADVHGHDHSSLGWAAIFHRIPESVGIWWLVRGRFGRRVGFLALAGIAGITALGHSFGLALMQSQHSSWLALLQAFAGGALLHIVTAHRLPVFTQTSDQPQEDYPLMSALGGMAGGALLFPLLHEGMHEVGMGFLRLAEQSAPALLLASATIALTKAFVPSSMVGFFHGRTRFGQSLRGTVAGLPIPICSCGVVPVYRGLISAGTPPSAALAFLVAAPEVGWAAILLSLGLLGPEMTLARVVGAAALALLIGVVIGRMVQAQPVAPASAEPSKPFTQRLREGAQYGFGTIVDDTAPWILFGLVVAAALEPTLQTDVLTSLPVGMDVLLATLIGLPLYVCASGSTPLVAVLLLKGLSPGAAIAFLLTGPATNLTTAGLLTQLHGKRVALAFSGAMVVFASACGFAVNAWMGEFSFNLATDLHIHNATDLSIPLLLLGLLYFGSLARLGVPGFISKVIRPHDHTVSQDICCAPPEEPEPPCCSH